jgi:hypothetical protein
MPDFVSSVGANLHNEYGPRRRRHMTFLKRRSFFRKCTPMCAEKSPPYCGLGASTLEVADIAAGSS